MAGVARCKVTDRWVRLPVDRVAIEEGCYFDEEAADRAIRFIEAFCKHSSGRKWFGKPFILLPWERDLVSRMWGWMRANGTRRFREVYIEIPKKNGKSSLLATLCLLALFEEPGAEVYPGACNRKQSDPVYRTICQMIESSPALRKHLKLLRYNKSVTLAKRNSRLKVLSADAESEDGHNASFTLLDEVHRFRNSRLYDVMKYAGEARDQPMLVSITTAGTDRHSICYELHKRAKALIEGATDDVELLGVIYGADPEKDDLDDPAVWHRVNPSLGVILDADDFRKQYEKAKRLPRTLNEFLRLRLGVWTEQETRWLSLGLWDVAEDPVDPSWWAGAECHAALDLSNVKDLTSLSLAARVDDMVRVTGWTFMPEATAARRSEIDGVPYTRWIDSGDMLETPGYSTDYNAIRRKINDLRDQGVNLLSIGIDPWNAQQFADQLIEDGFNVVKYGQRFASLSGPSKELERLLLGGRLRHDGNPVTRWAVGNVATRGDSQGNIMPCKKKSTERIDPVVSMVMAIGLAMGPTAPTGDFQVL